MIYVVSSSKGGEGKSTIAYHALTAILPSFKLVEIDDNNSTSAVFQKSETLKDRVKSVKLADGAEAFDDAIFVSMKDGADIIIDAGGGNDSKAVIEMILKETEAEDTIFLIPLMSGRAQLQNALDTYELVKERKVVFILNAADKKESFVFWYGSDKYDLQGVDKKIQKLPTAFIPQSPLFDLAAIDGEILADVADVAKVFQDNKEAQEAFFNMANGDIEEFKRLKSRYRISTAAKSFIENELDELRKILGK